MELLQKHFDTALESPDGIKKLRELILTLAMQGKLVKQDPKDQPASELLKEIQAEKERLIKKDIIKKQKELPPIKPDEVPYKVPEGWVWTRLGEICIGITSGSTPPQSEFNTVNGIPFLKVYNIKNQKIDFHYRAQFVNCDYEDQKMKRSRLFPGDVIMNIVGPPLGKVAIIPNEYPAYNCNQAIVFFRPYIREINTFIYSYLLSGTFLKRIELIGTAGQDNISVTKSNAIEFPLPPLAEQKRIVAKIDELMELCDKLEEQRKACNDKRLAVHTSAINRLLTASDKNDFDSSWQFITRHFEPLYSVKGNVAELKKAIFTLAMQGKLVEQDPKDQPASQLLKKIQTEKKLLIKKAKIKNQKELPPINPEEIPYEVPEGWVWVRLGEIGVTQTGTTPATKDSYNFGDYIPFIGPGDIQNQVIDYSKNGLSEKGLNNGRLIPKNSILMVCIGGSIGKQSINSIDVACNQQINTITPFTIEVGYLFYVMWSDYFQTRVILNAGGSATPIINKNKWSMITIPLAPLAEQKRIVARIDELKGLCDKLENQIDQATAKQTDLFDAVLAEV